MQFHDPNATPLDLRFRLFGTDVRVSPWFWLIAAFLGWRSANEAVLPGGGLLDVAVWIACAFVSILLHEFGHIWMGRVFGSRGYILLQGMGGLAVGSTNISTPWKRILISAAGPAIQLVFYGVLYALDVAGAFSFLTPLDNYGKVAGQLALDHLLWINLAWPILNLLPIWPLDGGQITREVFQIVSPRKGLLASLWVSVLVAAALAVHAILWAIQPMPMARFNAEVASYAEWLATALRRFGGRYLIFLFGFLAVGSFLAIQEQNTYRKRYQDTDDNLPWER